jgi:drug/metabolite transporter (DMT)-like permease
MKTSARSLYILAISNIAYGLLPITVKLANRMHYSPVEETFLRFVFALLGILILWSTGLQRLTLVNRQALFWRGVFGSLSILAYFVALQTTSSGKGTLLNYTYILWTNVFAVMFFGQKPPRRFFWFLLLASVGIDLVLDVRWDHLNWGDLAGLISGITGGAAVLAIKRVRYTDTALTDFTSLSLFGFVLSGCALLGGGSMAISTNHASVWTTPDLWGGLALIGIGATAMMGQLLFSETIGHMSLALGTLLALAVPVLAALFGWIFLGEPLTPHFLVGMVFVLTACGAMIWQENQNQA